MSDKAAVFIDGAYLDKVLQEEFNSPRIDYEKLAHWMTRGVPLFRSYYYHCINSADSLSKNNLTRTGSNCIPAFASISRQAYSWLRACR